MAEAAKIKGTRHIGSLIVMKFWTPFAIVTELDLHWKVLAGGLTSSGYARRSRSGKLPALLIYKKGRLAVLKMQ
jgi:hypothetical protein